MKRLLAFVLCSIVGFAGDMPGWQDLPVNGKSIAVDARSGNAFMMRGKDHGVWLSTDQGQTWTRCDNEVVRGNLFFARSLDSDPRGGRMVGFCRDPESMPCSGGLSLDGGVTWTPVVRMFTAPKKPEKKNGDMANYGWSWGTADWRAETPRVLLAKLHHRSEIWISEDGGADWRLLVKGPRYVGIVDRKTFLVAGNSRNPGIDRSDDGGRTWKKVAKFQITDPIAVPFPDRVYWLARKGMVVSEGDGASWTLLKPFNHPGWGPFISPDQKRFVVVDADAVHLSQDSGQTWVRICPNPAVRAGRITTEEIIKLNRKVHEVDFAVDFNRDLIYVTGKGLSHKRTLSKE